MLFINPSSQWDQHLVSDTGTWTTTLARGTVYTVTIVQPDSCKELSYILSRTPACFHSQNGSLSLLPEGGISPYTIQWNTGNPADTLATLSGLGANAMHRATITDARGCNLRTAMAIVSQSSPVRADTSMLAALKLVLNGGGSPYEIQISGDGLSMPLLFTGIADTLALSSLNDGLYTLQVKDANACTYDLGEIKLMHAGILAGRAAKELVLYPNPAKGSTRVEGLKDFRANIYDSRGVFVRQLKDDNGELNLTTLNPGLYLLQIQKEDALYSQKLIVK